MCVCFLMRDKGVVDVDGRETGRSRGSRNHSENILHEKKNLFLMKEKHLKIIFRKWGTQKEKKKESSSSQDNLYIITCFRC